MAGVRVSSLPGNLGVKVNEMLAATPRESIVKEVHCWTGVGVAQTEHRLVHVRAGLLMGNACEWMIMSSIKSIQMRPVANAADQVQFTVASGEGSFTILASPGGDLEPLLEDVARQAGIRVDREEWLAAQEAARAAAAAAEAEIAAKREAASRSVVIDSFIQQLTGHQELSELYGPVVEDMAGRKAELGTSADVFYLRGIPAFDRHYEDSARKTSSSIEDVTHKVTFSNRGNGLSIQAVNGWSFWRQNVHWPHDAVERIELHEDAQSALQESKSLIGRALVGGVLLGPVGAVVGGLTGLGNRPLQGSGLLVFSLRHEAGAVSCIFTVSAKRYRTVEAFLKSIYGPRFCLVLPKAETSPAKSGSLVAELERLSEIRKQGHITDEEFRAAKAKLLA